MPRRGENIRKRADGRWEARYIRCYQPDGKAKYGYLYARTYAEVRKKKTEAQTQKPLHLNHGKEAPKRLFEVMQVWLDSRRGAVKQSTLGQYRAIIQRHLMPSLGAQHLEAFSKSSFEQYTQDKRENGRLDGKGGLSAKTVSDHVIVLKQIICFAVDRKWMSAESLSFRVSTPSGFKPELLSEWDWIRLNRLVRTSDSAQMLGVLIAMHTGLRIGEICALRYSDINFESGTLSVNHTVLRVKDMDANATSKTKILLDTPKTECSRRTIPLPAFLLPILSKGQSAASGAGAFIVAGTETCTEPRIFYRQYQALQKQCGIHGYTFHALRHTFATRCIENGCDPKTLSELLGHASVKITLERYVHPTMNAKRAAVEQLASVDSWSEKVVTCG